MSAAELANKLNISASSISKWEKGLVEPSLQNIKIYSEIFGRSLDWIINGEVDIVNKRVSKKEPEDINKDTTKVEEKKEVKVKSTSEKAIRYRQNMPGVDSFIVKKINMTHYQLIAVYALPVLIAVISIFSHGRLGVAALDIVVFLSIFFIALLIIVMKRKNRMKVFKNIRNEKPIGRSQYAFEEKIIMDMNSLSVDEGYFTLSPLSPNFDDRRKKSVIKGIKKKLSNEMDLTTMFIIMPVIACIGLVVTIFVDDDYTYATFGALSMFLYLGSLLMLLMISNKFFYKILIRKYKLYLSHNNAVTSKGLIIPGENEIGIGIACIFIPTSVIKGITIMQAMNSAKITLLFQTGDSLSSYISDSHFVAHLETFKKQNNL